MIHASVSDQSSVDQDQGPDTTRPTALTFRSERKKLLSEIHIQSLTQEAMCLERMHLECADGWQAYDANALESKDSEGNENISGNDVTVVGTFVS